MNQRKTWSAAQDQKLKQIVENSRNKELGWKQIAEILNQTTTRIRTGKQCRQRWHNQLKPGIHHDQEWSQKEVDTLFKAQEEHGNKWALMAKELDGRTDNAIKNFFYSTLRKALRKVNTYVTKHRKEHNYRNVKQFKEAALSKILAVAQGRHKSTMIVRKQQIVQTAKEIKRMLVNIQMNDKIVASEEKNDVLENVVQKILEFNRNCKRKKGKRKQSDDENEDKEEDVDQEMQDDQADEIQQEQQQSAPKPEPIRKKTKQAKNKQEDQSPQGKIKQSVTSNPFSLLNSKQFFKSANLQPNIFKPESESKDVVVDPLLIIPKKQVGNLNRVSSSSNNYSGAPSSSTPKDSSFLRSQGSSNFNNFMAESRMYNQSSKEGFILGMQMLQKKETIRQGQDCDNLWQGINKDILCRQKSFKSQGPLGDLAISASMPFQMFRKQSPALQKKPSRHAPQTKE